MSNQQLDRQIQRQFPRSVGYDRNWMVANSMGPNAVWLTEFLTQAMTLQPGMKVLDLGCGKAMSSVFLAREFGVEVWATDLWIASEDNRQRVREAGLVDQIHPVHAEAHDLPFDNGFFDAVVSIDAYHYFGTDDLYLSYLLQFVKADALLGFVAPGLAREFDLDPPDHLHAGWQADFACFHSAAWWRRHWQRGGRVDVSHADMLQDGWRMWAYWNEQCADAMPFDLSEETAMLKMDAGRNLGFVRLVATPRATPRWP